MGPHFSSDDKGFPFNLVLNSISKFEISSDHPTYYLVIRIGKSIKFALFSYVSENPRFFLKKILNVTEILKFFKNK